MSESDLHDLAAMGLGVVRKESSFTQHLATPGDWGDPASIHLIFGAYLIDPADNLKRTKSRLHAHCNSIVCSTP
jgi:hypothetical protein